MNAAMKAHAGGSGGSGGGKQPSANAEAPPSSSEKMGSPEMASGASKRRPAVRKGFLGSSGGERGTLYGEEGSREGGGAGGGDVGAWGGGGARRCKAAVDRDFERLVSLADPDMGGDDQASLDSSRVRC